MPQKRRNTFGKVLPPSKNNTEQGYSWFGFSRVFRGENREGSGWIFCEHNEQPNQTYLCWIMNADIKVPYSLLYVCENIVAVGTLTRFYSKKKWTERVHASIDFMAFSCLGLGSTMDDRSGACRDDAWISWAFKNTNSNSDDVIDRATWCDVMKWKSFLFILLICIIMPVETFSL